MKKPVILTGLRANNDLHIGHIFGAIRPIIDIARNKSEEFQVNMFVPDLHSFTTPIDHSSLQQHIMNNLKIFVAAGLPLDTPDVFIYRQSRISAHSELTIILNSFTGMGQMSRMTQYKDKSSKLNADQVTVGLFDYPVLMAADILLYDAVYIPVGDDQSQHIEFTRDIAERLNSRFDTNLFVIPKPVSEQHAFFGNDQGLRIKDLQNPREKMSKSTDNEKGILFLSDEPATSAQKVMVATTDSIGAINYDYENQPGISNLLQLLALLEGTTIEAVLHQFSGNPRYGDFKKVVADKVASYMADFQLALSQVDETTIIAQLESSEEKMKLVANSTLIRVQAAVGLR